MRNLYGASTAEFTFTLGTGTPAPILLAPGASLSIYTGVNGTPVNDLLASTDNLFTPGGAITSVTSEADGGFPFYAPDGTAGTLAAKTTVGGVDYWTLLNPSRLGDIVQALAGTVATNSNALTTQATNTATLAGRVTALEGVGTAAPAWTAITGKPATFAPDLSAGVNVAQINASADVKAMLAAASKAAVIATIGAQTAISGAPTAWPATFTPSPHVHTIADVTGLSAALAAVASFPVATGDDADLTAALGSVAPGYTGPVLVKVAGS